MKIIASILISLFLSMSIAPLPASANTSDKIITIEDEVIDRNTRKYKVYLNGEALNTRIYSHTNSLGEYYVECLDGNDVTRISNINGVIKVSSTNEDQILESNIESSNILGNKSSRFNFNEVFPNYYRSWSKYTWSYGHLNFYRGIAVGTVVSIILALIGGPVVATAVVGALASAIVTESLEDVYYAKGRRYKLDKENERYIVATLCKFYRDSYRTSFIKQTYNESGPIYYNNY